MLNLKLAFDEFGTFKFMAEKVPAVALLLMPSATEKSAAIMEVAWRRYRQLRSLQKCAYIGNIVFW